MIIKKIKDLAFFKIMFNVLLMLILLTTFILLNLPLRDLSSFCEINDLETLEKCAKKNNPLVKIKVKEVFPTNYSYTENGIIKGYFLDINISSKALITLVSIKEDRLLFKELDLNKDATIYGRLKPFKGVYLEGLNAIKEDYVKDYLEEKKDLTKEDVLDLFLPYNINQLDKDIFELI
ncbi:MAG: hypothetical protein RSE91_03980, partial [Bacilli bacterium]